jgi:hypothetical protein
MYDDEEMTAKKAKEAEGIETRSRRNRSRTRTRKETTVNIPMKRLKKMRGSK